MIEQRPVAEFIRVGENVIISTREIVKITLNKNGARGWLTVRTDNPHRHELIEVTNNEFYAIADELCPNSSVRKEKTDGNYTVKERPQDREPF